MTLISFAKVKERTIENVVILEKHGIVSRINGFQDIINSIAHDLRTKHRQRIQRHKEKSTILQTIAQLEKKAQFLDLQLQSFHSYVEQALGTLQVKKG